MNQRKLEWNYTLKTGLVFLLLFTYFKSHAQVLTLIDREAKTPLEGVIVLGNRNNVLFSNASGKIDLSSMSNSDSLEFRLSGYETLWLSRRSMRADSTKTISMTAGGIPLDEIIISASKSYQRAGSIPAQIATVSAKEVELVNPQTSADLLGLSGTVFIQKSQQGGGSPMIRGFSTNRLLYSVDGVRMNSAIFRQGNIQNVINLDPFSLEKVEVFMGPNTVMYGSDAIGGVLSSKTLGPRFAIDNKNYFGLRSTLRNSTANKEKTGHLDVRFGTKKWAFVSSVSLWDFDDLRQGKYGPADYLHPTHVQRTADGDVEVSNSVPEMQVPTAYAQKNFMQKIAFRPNANWLFTYGFHHSGTSEYGRYDRHQRQKNGLPRYAEWNYGPQVWQMHNLEIIQNKGSRFYDNLVMLLASQKFEESRITRGFNSSARSINAEMVNALSVNLDLIKDLSPKVKLFYGYEGVLNKVISTGKEVNIKTNSEKAGLARYPNSLWNSNAIYIKGEYAKNKRLNFVTGLRLNRMSLFTDFTNNLPFYQLDFDTYNKKKYALTGSLGSAYQVSKSLQFTARLGTAFRAPNADDLGKVFDSSPGYVTVPNPRLMPEYAYNAEAGISKSIENRFLIKCNGYLTYLNHAMVVKDFIFNGSGEFLYEGELNKVRALQNSSFVRVIGAYLGLYIALTPSLKFSSDINIQSGKEKQENGDLKPSRHAPPAFGIHKLMYHHKGFEMEFYVPFQLEAKHDQLAPEEQDKTEIYAHDGKGETYAPAWVTLNLKASYHLTSNLSCNAGIENILNARYRPYSSGVSAAGRNLVVSLSLKI